jgi:hypothetical protein
MPTDHRSISKSPEHLEHLAPNDAAQQNINRSKVLKFSRFGD